MPRLSTVVFDPLCDVGHFPAVKSRSVSLFSKLVELEESILTFGPDGIMRKTGLGGSMAFVSKDACGTIPLYLDDRDSPAFVAVVLNGELSAIVSGDRYSGPIGFRFVPQWKLDLRASETVADIALRRDPESMLDLIRMIEHDRSVQVTRSLDLMAGIALCDKDRLHGLSSQHAWTELSDIEQQAVVQWLSTSPHANESISV